MMVMGIRVAGDEEGERDESCDKESNGFGGKSDGNEGGRRLTATRAMAKVMATTWVMVTVTRLAGDKEGKGEGGKGDGNGDEGDLGGKKLRSDCHRVLYLY